MVVLLPFSLSTVVLDFSSNPLKPENSLSLYLKTKGKLLRSVIRASYFSTVFLIPSGEVVTGSVLVGRGDIVLLALGVQEARYESMVASNNIAPMNFVSFVLAIFIFSFYLL